MTVKKVKGPLSNKTINKETIMKLNVFKNFKFFKGEEPGYVEEDPNEGCSEYRENDDGTIVNNVVELEESVIGRRIVSAEKIEVEPLNGRYHWGHKEALVLTLDDGTQVRLRDTDDFCAYTTLNAFLLHPNSVDHMILGVGTTEEFTTWHIYADFGDVMVLDVSWSCGNPFYYGYGFDIEVVPHGKEDLS
jgi:hypothetical protein